jgi:hypothetical protein
MALGWTQQLTEMSIRNLPGRVKWLPVCKADNLMDICESTVQRKCGSLDVSQPHRPPPSVTGSLALQCLGKEVEFFSVYDFWLQNIENVHLTDKGGSDKIDISYVGPSYTRRYFPEVTAYAVHLLI